MCPICSRILPPVPGAGAAGGHALSIGEDVLANGIILQGRYEIQSLIHSGGMGYIYAASDIRLRRQVVIKLVREQVKSGPHLEKLEQEALSMARLSHPSVAMVLDHFTDNNYYFLVVEFVPGKTLSEIFDERSQKLTEAEVVGWMLPVCEAVDYIHSQGLVHRDISPDNIMLTPEGRIKLIDFGTLYALSAIAGGKAQRRALLHAAVEGRELSSIDDSKASKEGKFGFTPKEQWQGQPVPQSDVFAIGATIYYLLTGFLPVSEECRSGGKPQEADFHPTYSPIKQLRADITQKLEGVLQKALTEEIDDRYADARGLSNDLIDLQPLPGQVVHPLLKAKLLITKSKVNLGFIDSGSIVQKIIYIANEGEEPLVGTITSQDPTVTVSPSTINVIKQAEHTISMDTTHIRPTSRYSAHIYVSTNGGKGSIEVKWAGRAVLNKLIKKIAVVSGACILFTTLVLGIAVWQSNEAKSAAAMDPVARIEPLSGVPGTEFKVTGKGPKSAKVGYKVMDAGGKSIESLSANQNAGGDFSFIINTANYPTMGEYTCRILSANGKSCEMIFNLVPNLSDIKIAYSDEMKPPGQGWFTGLMTEETENTFISEQDSYSAFIASRRMLYHVYSPKQCVGRDFAVSVDIERVSNTGDEVSGISFREQDEMNYYAFLVDPLNQQYSVVQVADINWYEKVPWQGSSIIDKKKNILSVATQDGKIYFYINEQIMKNIDDDNKDSPGYIGLAAGTLFKPDAKFKFTNFKLHSANAFDIDKNNAVFVVLPRQNHPKPDYHADLVLLDFWTDYPNPYIYYKIKNTGCAISEPSKTYLYLSGGSMRRDTSSVSPMLPGEIQVLQFKSYILTGSTTVGELVFRVCVDAENNNVEENENNCLEKPADSKGSIAPTKQSDNVKTPPKMGQIAFLRCASQSKNSDWGNKGRIFLLNTDGTGLSQISLASITPIKPDSSKKNYKVDYPSAIVWSPDGSKIAFSAETSPKNMDIFYADSNGANGKPLAVRPAFDVYPTWSPDGRKIAFSSNFGSTGGSYIYVADIDSERDPVKGPLVYAFASDLYPSYAKDGSHILYVTNYGGEYGIYDLDLSSMADKKISKEALPALSRPATSPDGTRFAYVIGKDDQKEIWVRNIDGNNPVRLTKDDGYLDDYPCWSPDGTKIAYVHLSYKLDGSDDYDVSQSGIYIMNNDGSDPMKIPGTTHLDWSPTWK